MQAIDNSLHILLIGRTGINNHWLSNQLQAWGYNAAIQGAASITTAISLLPTAPWNLIFVDYDKIQEDFPVCDVLKMLQGQEIAAPCIVLTEGLCEADATQFMRLGACDCLSPQSPRLPAVVARELQRVELLQSNSRLQVALASQREQEGRMMASLAAAERQAREWELLHQVRSLAAREVDAPSFFRAVVQAIHQVFGYCLVSIYLRQEIEQAAAWVLQHALGSDSVQERIALTAGVMGKIVRTRQPCLSQNSCVSVARVASVTPISQVAAPLFVQEQIVGVLNIESYREQQLNESDLRMITTLGQYISLALERIRLFDALRDGDARFRTLVANLPGAVYRCANDEEWTNEFLNDGIEIITGYPASDFIQNHARSFASIIHPEDRAAVRTHISNTLGQRAPFELEYRIVHADGSIRWLSEHGQGVWDERGEVRWLEGVLFDITERKQTEAALHQSQVQQQQFLQEQEQAALTLAKRAAEIEEINASLDSIIENLPTMLFMKDAQTLRFVRWNKAAEEQVGLDRRDVLGKDDYDFFPTEQADFFHAKDREVLALGQIVEIPEEKITTKRGDRLLYTRKVPIMGSDGQPKYLLGVSIDITERKQAEESIRQLNAELARAVRLKDEFLANMSHELRTPLNAILTLSEMLKMGIYGSLQPRQSSAVSNIEKSGRHLLALINDILDVAKIASGKLELEIAPVDVQGLCQDTLQMVQETARQKQIKLLQTFDHSLGILLADGRRLAQILVNLLSNAIKFTPEGGKVGLEVMGDAERQAVYFAVWDTGIGIATEDRDKLFQPFVQLDSRLARQYEGTGLGLALVYRLTEMHGGSVTLESELGKGSRFTVSLPWRTHTTAYAVPRFDPATALYIEPPHIGDHLMGEEAPIILLVDDNELSVEIVESYLLTQNCRVITAHNGLEALEQIQRYPPHLILMDIQMPEMDGLQTARQIRLRSDLANIPIIALTALAMRGDRERCLEAGINDYLSKPINLHQLSQIMGRLLNGK